MSREPKVLGDGARKTISKQMSRILRHAPPREIDGGGWVPLPVLLSKLKSKPSEADIRMIIEADSKGRFAIDDNRIPPRVRATQGHSFQLSEPVLNRVRDPSDVPVAVHVTREEGWSAIQESGELRRMSRTHIHFATKPNHQRANAWATVLLLLDLRAAMEAGLEFFTSTNDVLLCEGPLPVRFVSRITEDKLWHLRSEARAQAQAEDDGSGGSDAGARTAEGAKQKQ